MRKFVVCINNATKEQEDIVTQFLKDGSFGFWHWMGDLWLVTIHGTDWTAATLRDKLNSLVPGPHKLVIQIDGPTVWAGFSSPKAFDWFPDNWDKG